MSEFIRLTEYSQSSRNAEARSLRALTGVLKTDEQLTAYYS